MCPRWPFLGCSPREPDAGSGGITGPWPLPSQQRREAEPAHGSGMGLASPPQTPGLAQQPRLPCSRPRGPSEGEPHGPQPRLSIFNKQGDSCQESCPPQGASPVAPAPPQGQGSTGGAWVHRGDRGPQGGQGVHGEARESTWRTGVHRGDSQDSACEPGYSVHTPGAHIPTHADAHMHTQVNPRTPGCAQVPCKFSALGPQSRCWCW